jgi:spore coat polysaccharide biosynthesis protein SpsF
MVKIGGIILCRLDSRRLPGKVLRDVRGKPLISYVISRAQQIPEFKGNLVVATSDREVDDPIERFCNQQNIKVFRGSASNVSLRVLTCALEHEMTHFLRINADSPFLEPQVASRACKIAEESDYDFVTNLQPRTFPYGVSIELFKTQTYQRAFEKMSTEDHYEHVTLYLYQNIEEYSFYSITHDGEDLSKVRLTVDTESDMEMFEHLLEISNSDWKHYSYVDAAEAYCRLSATLQ